MEKKMVEMAGNTQEDALSVVSFVRVIRECAEKNMDGASKGERLNALEDIYQVAGRTLPIARKVAEDLGTLCGAVS